MKKYHIKMNDKVFEIEIEEALNGISSLATSSEDLVSQSVETAVKSSNNEGEEILAPLPGTVLTLSAPEGTSVKQGDVVMVLEAMKMENEIVAPKDGTIHKIHVDKGTSVITGECLLVMV